MDWPRVSELFHQALEVPEGLRAQWLNETLSETPEVRAEVESLLDSHARADDFLESSPHGLTVSLAALSLPTEFQSGQVVGDFCIQRVLGRGSFATVYLATQLSLGREVALKVSADLGDEARTMAPLEHAHIVRVFSEWVEPQEKLRFLCIQYVPGLTLEEVWERLQTTPPDPASGGEAILTAIEAEGPSTTSFDPSALRERQSLWTFDFVDSVLWIGSKLADALSYAHARGVLHLDVKPSNVLLDRYGRPMLTDFNVALNRAGRVTGGTPEYMAPEHHRAFEAAVAGEKTPNSELPLDARADIFSLGVLLTNLLECAPEVEREVLHVLRKACAPVREARYSSASALSGALRALLSMRSVRRELPAPSRLMRMALSHPTLALWFGIVGPQILGSGINIAYNDLRIVSHLSETGRVAFYQLVVVYNAVVYPLGLWILYRRVRDTTEVLRASQKGMVAPQVRQRLLQLPRDCIAPVSLGWLPGVLFFPLGISILSGAVPLYIYAHFLLSFLVSWSVALTYTCLVTQGLVTAGFYPQVWNGRSIAGRLRDEELTREFTRLKVFYFLAGIIPSGAAIWILMQGPDSLSPHHLHTFQGLVAYLILTGMLGCFASVRLFSHQTRVLSAFHRLS